MRGLLCSICNQMFHSRNAYVSHRGRYHYETPYDNQSSSPRVAEVTQTEPSSTTTTANKTQDDISLQADHVKILVDLNLQLEKEKQKELADECQQQTEIEREIENDQEEYKIEMQHSVQEYVDVPDGITPEGAVVGAATLRTQGHLGAVQGSESPDPGDTSAMQGVDSPMQGVESTIQGDTSAIQGVDSPMQGVKSPIQGINSPIQENMSSRGNLDTIQEQMKSNIRTMEGNNSPMQTNDLTVQENIGAMRVNPPLMQGNNISKLQQEHSALLENFSMMPQNNSSSLQGNFNTIQGSNSPMQGNNSSMQDNNYTALQMTNFRKHGMNHAMVENNYPSQGMNPALQGNFNSIQDINPLMPGNVNVMQERNTALNVNHSTMQRTHPFMQGNFNLTQGNNAMPINGGWGVRSDERMSKMMCNLCQQVFTTRVDFITHLGLLHDVRDFHNPSGGAGTHQCVLCMKRFHTSRRLTRHVVAYHSNLLDEKDGQSYPQQHVNPNTHQNQSAGIEFPGGGSLFRYPSAEHAAQMNQAGLSYLNPAYAGNTDNANNMQSPLLPEASSRQAFQMGSNVDSTRANTSFPMELPYVQPCNFNSLQLQHNFKMLKDYIDKREGAANGRSANTSCTADAYNLTPPENIPPRYLFPTHGRPASARPSDGNSEIRMLQNNNPAGGLITRSASVMSTLPSPNVAQYYQQNSNMHRGFTTGIQMQNGNGVGSRRLQDIPTFATLPTSLFLPAAQQKRSRKSKRSPATTASPSQKETWFNAPPEVMPTNSIRTSQDMLTPLSMPNNTHVYTESHGNHRRAMGSGDFLIPQGETVCPASSCDGRFADVQNNVPNKTIANEQVPLQTHPNSMNHATVNESLTGASQTNVIAGANNRPGVRDNSQSSAEDDVVEIPIAKGDRATKRPTTRLARDAPRRRRPRKLTLFEWVRLPEAPSDPSVLAAGQVEPSVSESPARRDSAKTVKEKIPVKLQPPDFSAMEFAPSVDPPQTERTDRMQSPFKRSPSQQSGAESKRSNSRTDTESLCNASNGQSVKQEPVNTGRFVETPSQQERSTMSPSQHSLLQQDVAEYSPLRICSEPNLSILKTVKSTTKRTPENVNPSPQRVVNGASSSSSSSSSSEASSRSPPRDELRMTSSEIKITTKFVVEESDRKNKRSYEKTPSRDSRPLQEHKMATSRMVELLSKDDVDGQSPARPAAQDKDVESRCLALTPATGQPTAETQRPQAKKLTTKTFTDIQEDASIPSSLKTSGTITYFRNLRTKIATQKQTLAARDPRQNTCPDHPHLVNQLYSSRRQQPSMSMPNNVLPDYPFNLPSPSSLVANDSGDMNARLPQNQEWSSNEFRRCLSMVVDDVRERPIEPRQFSRSPSFSSTNLNASTQQSPDKETPNERPAPPPYEERPSYGTRSSIHHDRLNGRTLPPPYPTGAGTSTTVLPAINEVFQLPPPPYQTGDDFPRGSAPPPPPYNYVAPPAHVEVASVAPPAALYVYRCSRCFQTFKTASQARRHTQHVHNDAGRRTGSTTPPATSDDRFVMQEFLLEQPGASARTAGMEIVRALVYLPVRERVTGRVTIPVTFIPNDD